MALRATLDGYYNITLLPRRPVMIGGVTVSAGAGQRVYQSLVLSVKVLRVEKMFCGDGRCCGDIKKRELRVL